MTRASLIFISTTSFPCRRNSTRYQRLRHLGEKYQLYFLGKGFICPELEPALEQIHLFRYHRALKGTFPLWAALHARTLAHRVPIDAVYTTYEPLSLLAGFLLKKSGFVWIIELWDDPEKSSFVAQSYRGLRAALRLGWHRSLFLLARRVIKQADLVITQMKPETKEKYHVDDAKILPVTNGVDLSIEYPPSPPPSTPFTVTFVGALMRTRLDTLIEAMDLLSRDVPDFHLVLIGPLQERQDRMWLNRVAESPRLQGKVTIRGELEHDQVLAALAQADVCVCPYPNIQDLNPTYPVKVFEYMAMGKAVVATQLRGISEIIQDGQSGLLVPPGNPQALAEAIRTLYSDESLRERLGQGARERVKAFEWSTINARISTAIDDLIDRIQE